MDDALYKLLKRVAIILTIAWIGWTLYDSNLRETSPGAHEIFAATKLLEDGQYEEALLAYEKALQVDPDNIGLLRGKAQALMRMGIEEEFSSHQLTKDGKENEAYKATEQSVKHFHMALALYNKAIYREESLGITESNQDVLGISYANRGILKDQMGDYPGALADYDKSMELEPEVKEGPGFMTRFMRNQPEKPPTVADRAHYLRQQLAKPETERLMNLPEEDAKQRSYKMD